MRQEQPNGRSLYRHQLKEVGPYPNHSMPLGIVANVALHTLLIQTVALSPFVAAGICRRLKPLRGRGHNHAHHQAPPT